MPDRNPTLILYSSGGASKDRHIHNFRKAGRIAWWLRTGFYRIRVGAAVPGIGTQDDRSMVSNQDMININESQMYNRRDINFFLRDKYSMELF